MRTLTKLFESRLDAFLERTGLKPSMFGLRAAGDPNLIRQLRRGRSPTLKLADRILAFMDAYDEAHEDRTSSRRRLPEDAALRDRRARAVTGAFDQEIEVPVLILPLPVVRARTGESWSIIRLRVAGGSFPQPVCVVGWLEKDLDAWIRQQIPANCSDLE